MSTASGEQSGTHPVALGLQRLTYNAIATVDPELRAGLANNVLLVGGGSLVPGLPQRLQGELAAIIPTAFRPRVVFASHLERKFAPWIGGSVLVSLGNFQKLWISRSEYDEEGPAVVDRKCS
jgi:actin-related protein